MRGHWIRYSPEELAWLEENKAFTRRDLHRLFVMRFGRDDVKIDDIKSLCTRKGWRTGRTGCFEKGAVPANKGKKMPYNANSARTQFKKGQLSGTAAARKKPIGAERFSKEGYIERKIHDGMPLQSRWRGVHRIRWEEKNGPVPAGYALKCLDGNRRNTDPDNWEAIPRGMIPRLGGRYGYDYDHAPDELKPTLMALAKVKHQARQRRQRKEENP